MRLLKSPNPRHDGAGRKRDKSTLGQKRVQMKLKIRIEGIKNLNTKKSVIKITMDLPDAVASLSQRRTYPVCSFLLLSHARVAFFCARFNCTLTAWFVYHEARSLSGVKTPCIDAIF
jgi:hypothetical protein